MRQTLEADVAHVRVPGNGVELSGDLALPMESKGVVLFAHGSGSSRHSSRNKYVASELNHACLATLLFDLLTEEEELEEQHTRHLRFNIGMLAERLIAATDWASKDSRLADLPVGYFGASTGGGAALVATAARPVGAVVSRGGRPDLAGDALPYVQAPTLLSAPPQPRKQRGRARRREILQSPIRFISRRFFAIDTGGSLLMSLARIPRCTEVCRAAVSLLPAGSLLMRRPQIASGQRRGAGLE